jgi:hypothetical protein
MKHVIPLNLVELEAENYHITISSIFKNGAEGLWIIDTGASKTVFNQSLIELYEPIEMDENSQIQSAGIGAGHFDTSLGELMAFMMGALSVDPLHVALIDLSHINKLYFKTTQKEICGLIGSDFLLERKAIIDYEKLELVIEG